MPRVARALVVALVLAASVASAQERWGRGWGGRGRFPPRYPAVTSFDGGFNFCRLIYDSDRSERGGSGWSTDYWDADRNFSTRLGELTKTTISRRPDGTPNHLTVRMNDPLLFQCPFLSATDVGTALFSDDEAEVLRKYLLKGGFLWVDDFWGPYAWESWVNQISKVLPLAQFPIRDIPLDHAIRRTLFEFTDLPQIPSINFWRESGGETSERYEMSAQPNFRGIADEHGRLMVVMTHNTDISDAWEREAADPQFFFSFSPQGYAVGLDVVLYGLTH
ncbi:MAG: hypothetical protein RJA55_931 [Acidobacteriota bacterium]|jgi:hypothetical protein